MNKKIYSPLALGTIIAITLIFCVYVWTENKSLRFETSIPSSEALIVKRKIKPVEKRVDKTKKQACQVHAYQGKAVVKVWKTKTKKDNQDNKIVLRISDADTTKMPSAKISEVELIDSNPKIEKTLANSSPQKPVELVLTGVATPCNKIPLACLNYKDGIFRPYL